jgi:hypothetical protein
VPERPWTKLGAYETTLERKGYADVQARAVGADLTTIDFAIDMKGPGLFTRQLHKSSIVVDPDVAVKLVELRFPTFSRKVWDNDEVYALTERAYSRSLPGPPWDYRMARTATGYDPHITAEWGEGVRPTVPETIRNVSNVTEAIEQGVF